MTNKLVAVIVGFVVCGLISGCVAGIAALNTIGAMTAAFAVQSLNYHEPVRYSGFDAIPTGISSIKCGVDGLIVKGDDPAQVAQLEHELQSKCGDEAPSKRQELETLTPSQAAPRALEAGALGDPATRSAR